LIAYRFNLRHGNAYNKDRDYISDTIKKIKLSKGKKDGESWIKKFSLGSWPFMLNHNLLALQVKSTSK
jgi:hypothetical protein